MPSNPQLFTAEVRRSARLSESFQRVTVAGPELLQFPDRGFDQWFRLFLPPRPEAALVLPGVKGRAWYRSYLMIPKGRRPTCSNYTVAGYRRVGDQAELDIDVVLHWDQAGQPGGAVARWATTAQPGAPLGLLEQGLLFDPPPDAAGLVLVADQTGLPAVRGILRSLAPSAVGSALIEVPSPDDIGQLEGPEGIAQTWITPAPPDAAPGATALAHLRAGPAPQAGAYAFVAGESALAAGARRHLHQAGLAKSRITFTGFWKRSH
jgi:NADPH-dependent ferric siderophore reductase